MKWVSERIGEEYKKWESGSMVFIASPTGSGKTQFILKTLLPYFSKENKKILYLVNRRILKKQMEEDISKLPDEQRSNIVVELYQSIENKFCSVKPQQNGYRALGYDGTSFLNKYNCVVCDECHYFLADANYNTNTIVSFRLVKEHFERKIRIFMSATINGVQDYILEHENEKNKRNRRTRIYEFLIPGFDESTIGLKKKVFTYKTDIDYNYLDIMVIDNKTSSIIDLVKENRDKWLIFVDNISFGLELRRELMKSFRNEAGGDESQDKKVVMLSSNYEKNEESADEVNMVVEKNIFRSKVIISTSVMDNGINIEDPELRNMIVIADNETEFIQMLGRKRGDGQKLKLYIVQQPKDYFAKRQRLVQKRLKIADEYKQWIYGNLKKCLTPEFVEYYQKKYLEMYHQYQQGKLLNKPLNYWQEINRQEYLLVLHQHILTMQKIANKEVNLEDAASLFLVFNGNLYLNMLSIKNFDKLNLHYQKILEHFEGEGTDAFVREQLTWLGKTPEEMDEIIKDSKITKEEKNYSFVMEKLQEIVDVSKEEKEAIDFKKGIADKLLVLVEAVDESISERNTVINAIKKNDRPLSKKNMDFLREYCNLPFSMDAKGNKYTLKRCEIKK